MNENWTAPKGTCLAPSFVPCGYVSSIATPFAEWSRLLVVLQHHRLYRYQTCIITCFAQRVEPLSFQNVPTHLPKWSWFLYSPSSCLGVPQERGSDLTISESDHSLELSGGVAPKIHQIHKKKTEFGPKLWGLETMRDGFSRVFCLKSPRGPLRKKINTLQKKVPGQKSALKTWKSAPKQKTIWSPFGRKSFVKMFTKVKIFEIFKSSRKVTKRGEMTRKVTGSAFWGRSSVVLGFQEGFWGPQVWILCLLVCLWRPLVANPLLKC